MDMSAAARSELSNLLHSLCDKFGVGNGYEELEREAERHLHAMRDSYMRLAKHGKSDVFVRYLLEQLEKSAAIFVEAANRDVLRVSEHQFSGAQQILDAFGSGNRVLRYTWKVNPSQRLFSDVGWRKHFELTSSMAASGALEIRTILVADNQHQYDTTNVQRLLEFYGCQAGMSAKAVFAADWESWMVDHGIPTTCIDFGIYGSNLLYTAHSYAPVDVGNWSRSAVEIDRFIRFFDSVWTTPVTSVRTPSVPTQRVGLSQLMSADSAVDRRHHNAVHESVARIEERIRPEVA